jgi:hypothetical protein
MKKILEKLSKAFPLIDDPDFEYQAKIIKSCLLQALSDQKKEIRDYAEKNILDTESNPSGFNEGVNAGMRYIIKFLDE